MFKPATRKQLRLRMTIDGPSGSGKTYTALRFAFGLVELDKRVAVIDTEHRAASKYKGLAPDGVPWDFDVCELEYFSPSTYASAIEEAGSAGYDVLIVDSLSHAWEGTGGALDQVDQKGGNKFTAWKDVTPMHRSMVEAILSSPCHVITTMRSKMEYVLEEDKGKMVPKKIGLAPIQRAGMEYEFDVIIDLDITHQAKVSKSRCPGMDRRTASNPDASFILPLIDWLGVGEAVAAPPQEPKQSGPTTRPSSNGQAATKANDKHEVNVHSEPCQLEQRQQIIELAKKLELTKKVLHAILAKRGANKLGELNYGQADKLRANLQAKVLEREGHSRF